MPISHGRHCPSLVLIGASIVPHSSTHHRLRVRRASQEFRGLGKKVPALSWLEVASVWVEIDPRLGKMPEDIL
jgi:hypothetical protein